MDNQKNTITISIDSIMQHGGIVILPLKKYKDLRQKATNYLGITPKKKIDSKQNTGRIKQ